MSVFLHEEPRVVLPAGLDDGAALRHAQNRALPAVPVLIVDLILDQSSALLTSALASINYRRDADCGTVLLIIQMLVMYAHVNQAL